MNSHKTFAPNKQQEMLIRHLAENGTARLTPSYWGDLMLGEDEIPFVDICTLLHAGIVRRASRPEAETMLVVLTDRGLKIAEKLFSFFS
jgi:hypothetical protein